MPSRNPKIKRVLLVPLLALVIGVAGDLKAATVTTSSGRRFDLSADQVERIKTAPGVYYLDYPSQKFIHGDLDSWEVIELPPDLGGGFIIGPVQSIQRALKRVEAKPPELESPIPPVPDTTESPLRIKRSRFDARLLVSTGMRQDDFDWNVAGNSSGTDPNIRTAVSWDDLSVWQLGTEFRADFRRTYHVRASLAYGRIIDGNSSQSDYLGDNRTNEFSRVSAASDSGSTLDASIAFGYHFNFMADRIGLTPLLGLAYNRQNLEMTDGYQDVSEFGFPAAEGPIPGLDNTYAATWKGAWIGLDLVFRPRMAPPDASDLQTVIGVAYHWADFSADGDWNLNTDLGQPDRFEQEASGTGFNLSASLEWLFKPHWGFNAGFVYRNWSAGDGTEKADFVDGSTTTLRLNDVNWQSYSINVGFTYRF